MMTWLKEVASFYSHGFTGDSVRGIDLGETRGFPARCCGYEGGI